MRGTRANPVVCGRRICKGCGAWRHISFFPYKRDRKDPERIYPQGTCESCKRIKERNKYATDPEHRERKKKNTREWKEKNLDYVRDYKRSFEYRQMRSKRRRAKYVKKRGKPLSQEEKNIRRRERHQWRMENEPGYAEDRREYSRIYQEARRRERGVKRREKAISRRRTESKKREPTLPAAPLIKWAEKRIAEEYGDWVAFGRMCGLDDRNFRRFRSGEDVTLSTVDRILTRDGTALLFEVYPEDEYPDLYV